MNRNLISGTFAAALASVTAANVATAQVTSNAALKALPAGSAPYIERAGYYVAGDGGDALYAWNETSTCTDDGGSCIEPNGAPSTGRWILNQKGAVSVKVFGAHCDDQTWADDTAALNAALSARSAVYVPANTTCYMKMTSPSSGLVLNDGNHLYGENQITSALHPYASGFAGSYDFVAGGRFTSIVVASNVGTVTTTWSHDMLIGNKVTISGSATSALNGTFTIQSVPTPNTFTIATSGVANGPYTDPTHLTGQSGIGTDVISSAKREASAGGNSFVRVEIDHLTIVDTSAFNDTIVDMTSMRSSTFHDLNFYTTGPGSGKIGFVCADQSPGNLAASCFFNNVYTINGPLDTVLHMSSYYGATGVNTFHQLFSYARVGINSTGTENNSMHAVFSTWYVDQPSSNSWDLFSSPRATYIPSNSTYIDVNFEGTANSSGYNTGDFYYHAATDPISVYLPLVNAYQGVLLSIVTVATLPPCTGGQNSGLLYAVSDYSGTPTYNATLTGGGSTTVPVFCNGSAWTTH